jgi:solute carrier family 25 carnitine/acylcarnitine transporter 20/29
MELRVTKVVSDFFDYFRNTSIDELFFSSSGTSRRTRATTTGACVVWGGEMPPPREHTHADASTSSPPSTSPSSIAVDMACGMAAGVAYTVTAHPFDTVKVAMQSRKNSATSGTTAPKSAIAVTSEIIKGPRGALGLFRGLTAPLVGYSIEAGVNYAAFNQSRRWLEHNNPFFPPNDDGSDGGDASSSSSKRSVTRHLAECAVSGALGGSLLSLVVAPTDLIKCRVQDGQFARASDAIRDVVVSFFLFSYLYWQLVC